jgi:hypothetical protein
MAVFISNASPTLRRYADYLLKVFGHSPNGVVATFELIQMLLVPMNLEILGGSISFTAAASFARRPP